MASKTLATPLLLTLSLLFFITTVSASSHHEKCITDSVKVGACINALNGLVKVEVNDPPVKPCCSLIDGLVDLEAAVCLCTALKANLLGINLNLPLDASVLVNNCGKKNTTGYTCHIP